jgi:hypothetical protein
MPASPLFDSRYLLVDVENALWLGALLLASGHEIEVCPGELDHEMVAYFALFRPLVQA